MNMATRENIFQRYLDEYLKADKDRKGICPIYILIRNIQNLTLKTLPTHWMDIGVGSKTFWAHIEEKAKK